jgi:uncharacterized protein
MASSNRKKICFLNSYYVALKHVEDNACIMDPENKKAILIFIKNPVMGQVKTRLAKKTGHCQALRIYRHLLDNTRRVTSEFENADKFLFYDRFIPCFDEWHSDVFSRHLQYEGPIDQKLINAFQLVFEEDFQRCIWLVPDCPKLTVAQLRKAFFELTRNDVTIGPTPGGGIYLLGLNNHNEKLLSGLQWGKGTLISDLIRRCQSQGLSHYLLPELHDVDFEEDLMHLNPKFNHILHGGSAILND